MNMTGDGLFIPAIIEKEYKKTDQEWSLSLYSYFQDNLYPQGEWHQDLQDFILENNMNTTDLFTKIFIT